MVNRRDWYVAQAPLGDDTVNTGLSWNSPFLTLDKVHAEIVVQGLETIPHQVNLGSGDFASAATPVAGDIIYEGAVGATIDSVPLYGGEQSPGIIKGDGVTTVFPVSNPDLFLSQDIEVQVYDNTLGYLITIPSSTPFSGDGDEVKLHKTAGTLEFETPPVDGSLAYVRTMKGSVEAIALSKVGAIVLAISGITIRNVKAGAVNYIQHTLAHTSDIVLRFYMTYDTSGTVISTEAVFEAP